MKCMVMTQEVENAQEEEESEAEKIFKRERSGGNYGGGTKEVQMANFRSRKEKEAKRKELFDEGLRKFGKNDIKGVGHSSTQCKPSGPSFICQF